MRVHQLLVALALGSLLPLACGDKDAGDGDDGTTDGGSADGGTADGGTDGGTSSPDADMDGVTVADGDCDDSNPDIHPGQPEDCDGVDQNCNGIVDEGFGDADGDTIADCMDVEDCDGLDNDGDGLIDEDFPDDNDNGLADCTEEELCDGIDNDGDGEVDELYDLDGDGYTSCGDDTVAPDCNDDDPDIHPGAEETSGDMLDNDCDGVVDEGDWGSGDLYITEVMNNPRNVIDTAGEWFEIYNASGRDVILNGLVITSTVDDDYHMVEDNELIWLPQGEHFVFGVNGDLYDNGDVEVGYVYGSPSGPSDIVLSNEEDDIVLMMDGLVIDEVSWDNGVSMPDPQGASITLDPTFYGNLLNDDADGWCAAQQNWGSLTDLGSPGTENEWCWPFAVASYDPDLSTLMICDVLYLVGSNSYDPDGAAITYEWELVSAPASSELTSADIIQTDDADPEFTADVPGTYVFSLTVYNGTEYSSPEFLTIEIMDRDSNQLPVAEPGDDIEYGAYAVCNPISYGVYYACNACSDLEVELDGTASWDPDDDEIVEYYWEITGGTGTGELEDWDTPTPTLTMGGPTPDYGDSASATVEVTLTVTDCLGAEGSEPITVTYECTSS